VGYRNAQLRIYGRFTSAEIAEMDDEEWLTELAHLAVIRQMEKQESLNEEIKLENLKRGK
jgi:hypothetical protein